MNVESGRDDDDVHRDDYHHSSLVLKTGRSDREKRAGSGRASMYDLHFSHSRSSRFLYVSYSAAVVAVIASLSFPSNVDATIF